MKKRCRRKQCLIPPPYLAIVFGIGLILLMLCSYKLLLIVSAILLIVVGIGCLRGR